MPFAFGLVNWNCETWSWMCKFRFFFLWIIFSFFTSINLVYCYFKGSMHFWMLFIRFGPSLKLSSWHLCFDLHFKTLHFNLCEGKDTHLLLKRNQFESSSWFKSMQFFSIKFDICFHLKCRKLYLAPFDSIIMINESMAKA